METTKPSQNKELEVMHNTHMEARQGFNVFFSDKQPSRVQVEGTIKTYEYTWKQVINNINKTIEQEKNQKY